MSWDFAVDDLRKELAELREKLAVQGVKVGEQESRLIKNEDELKAARENYADALNKLRKEADRSLELEEMLKKRTEELRNEKNARVNVEEALRIAKEERENEAASAREAQHYLNRVAVESNDYREQRENLTSQKARLEAQVRELQGELQRSQAVPLPQAKTPARPRSSSLTNLNKMATLERDMEQIRASASASELDLKSTQEKLSKAQTDFVRTENERAALEKRLKAREQRMEEILSEKDDLQTELRYYRDQGASHSRENDLLARLEEEEAKVVLLEKQLAQSSSPGANTRTVDRLQARVDSEISRREDLEAREIELVQEREEALNEVDDLKRMSEQLEQSVAQKDSRISELDARCRMIQEQLDYASRAAFHSTGVDEGKVTEMVNCIARLRAERDELRAHLEFVQMEAHFKAEALESKLAAQTIGIANDAQIQEYQLLRARLHDELTDKNRGCLKLQTAIQAMVITVQQLSVQASSAEEVNRIIFEQRVTLASRDEEVGEMKLRLSDASTARRTAEDARSALEEQVRQLEVDLCTIKQELADAMEHCERLEARQSSGASHDVITRSMKNEIEELRNRVMRRTEQIGLQQHDIKRLETNMSLMDERLEEVLGELEMAETAKVAMLEDCSIAREERDSAKKALMKAELDIERLSSRIREMEMETSELRAGLASMNENVKKAEASRDNASSLMNEVIVERDGRTELLTEQLEASEAALKCAEEQSAASRREIHMLQEAADRAEEDLQKQRTDKDTALEELERRTHEFQTLTIEMEASRLACTDVRNALEARNREFKRAHKKIDSLSLRLTTLEEEAASNATEYNSSALDNEKAAHQETKEALLTKGRELNQRTEDLHRLTIKLDAANHSQEESDRLLEAKEKELKASIAGLNRLLSELDANDANLKKHMASLEAEEEQVVEMTDKVTRLETEKVDLLTRLAAFEAETTEELDDGASLRSALEEERQRYDEQIRRLENDLASLRTEKENQLKASETIRIDLSARYEETLAVLETTRQELRGKQALYDARAGAQREASVCREDEAADLKKQLAGLSSEIDALQRSLQEEIDGRKQETVAHEEELRTALEKQESLSAIESELRATVEEYQRQVSEVRENLMTLQDENTTLQSDLDNLSGECHRANLKSQVLERQLASSTGELSNLRDDMSRLREALSKSEKSGKTAEMNLLLISQQHERTIASLRSQLKEHEKGAERIQKLQQIVGETREQISEMEALLKAKCAEIEENDDKFIQLLKEKKKLASKVESLTKKSNALQKKLSTPTAEAAVATSPPSEIPARRHSVITESVRSSSGSAAPFSFAPPSMPTHSAAKAEPLEPKWPVPSQTETPRESRRVSGSKRRREFTPPLDEIPVTTSIGKKRPFPGDSDSVCAPVEARLPDAFKPVISSSSSFPPASSSGTQTPPLPLATEFTSTPRTRRTVPRSGFTPVRGQSAAALRPTLSQPSPVKRSMAVQALRASKVISDITNSPPRSKRLFTTEAGSSEPRVERPAGKGWLGKIRGGANPLLRNRQQSGNESRP